MFVEYSTIRPSNPFAPQVRGLLGILLVQDFYLGIIMALLPLLSAIEEANLLEVLTRIGWLVGSFTALTVLTALLTTVESADERTSMRPD